MKLRQVPKNSAEGMRIRFNNFWWRVLRIIGEVVVLKIIFDFAFAK